MLFVNWPPRCMKEKSINKSSSLLASTISTMSVQHTGAVLFNVRASSISKKRSVGDVVVFQCNFAPLLSCVTRLSLNT